MNQLLHWKWEFLAPLFGATLTLAFAPYDFGYLGLITLIFFYLCCSVNSVRQATICGYLFGLGLFGSGIWWVYISIHDFGGGDPISSVLLTLLLVALWSLFPALTAFLAAKILRMHGVWFRIVAAALIWVAVEYLRGNWLLNGFPWLQVAYSQLDTPLAGFAPIVGVYGLGFVLTASAVAISEILLKKLSLFPGLLFVGLLWSLGWGLSTVQWTHAIGEQIQVTLVQGNIAQEQKWQADQKLNTLKRYQQLTEQHWDSNIIIWPETAIPAFLSQVKDFYLDPLSAKARKHKVDLVVSLPTSGAGKDYYNSVMTLGKVEAFYHKQHLLPFGEYLPLQPLSGWVLEQLQIPLGNFAAGSDRQPLLTAGGYPFITTICYEDAYGDLVSKQVEQAAFLVNVTNDAWFGKTAQPYQHMQMARLRALETGRYLLRATNTGLTGIVKPDGSISKQAPLFSTTTLTDNILPMSGLTPYARIGDNRIFTGLLILAAFMFSLTIGSQSNGQRS